MTKRDVDKHVPHNHDKQLQGISFEAVMEKRRLDQALNAKGTPGAGSAIRSRQLILVC
jgi:hypothetical protein